MKEEKDKKQKKDLEWEKPELVDFNQGEVGLGDCQQGLSAGDGELCTSGTGATTGCGPVGGAFG